MSVFAFSHIVTYDVVKIFTTSGLYVYMQVGLTPRYIKWFCSVSDSGATETEYSSNGHPTDY